jgi:hypothetical protein
LGGVAATRHAADRLNPQAEHLLDWFHITMRLTVMNQTAKGLGPEESESRAEALKQLESIKWYLWHGNVFKALRRIDHLEADLEDGIIMGESSEKLRNASQEFQTYIENNQQWIPNRRAVLLMAPSRYCLLLPD